ncbi:MAG: hypothetical protein IJ455_08490 [Agathobacter sp.]|nr:hypothetical protein [Agathobacter sp.]
MGRKVCNIFSIFLVALFLLTGCQKEEEYEEPNNIDLKQREAIEINDSIFTNQDLELKISEVSVDIDSRAEARTCFVYEEKVFYSLDYEFFFQDPTWSDGIEFDKSYNTQIRMYDMKSGEDRLLYQYDEEFCVVVLSLQYNGKTLIWEESNSHSVAWKIMAYDIEEDIKPHVLFKYGDVDGELNSATPKITEDSVLWYDLIKGRDYESVIYKYDFMRNNITVLKDGIDTWTPYARITLEDNVLLTYKYQNDSTSIFIEKESDCVTVETLGKVEALRGNNEMCAWRKSAEKHKNIQVYDIKNDLFYYIPTDYYFSFTVLDNVIIVNQDNGVYAYNIIDKTYMSIRESEGTYCGYLFDGWNCKYSFVNEDEDSKFTIMIIK